MALLDMAAGPWLAYTQSRAGVATATHVHNKSHRHHGATRHQAPGMSLKATQDRAGNSFMFISETR
ncbi:hypothetical protein ASE07_20050 [Noviherbaspirillum sp. Root189]|nr:hypothetical protein ASE07_20050 [Noviherbaspirillum sp. Root189]